MIRTKESCLEVVNRRVGGVKEKEELCSYDTKEAWRFLFFTFPVLPFGFPYNVFVYSKPIVLFSRSVK